MGLAPNQYLGIIIKAIPLTISVKKLQPDAQVPEPKRGQRQLLFRAP